MTIIDTERSAILSHEKSAVAWTLIDEGFPPSAAEAWADCWNVWLDPYTVIAQAIAYDDHGVPLDQAINWLQHGFLAAQATCFYDHRYTPLQAATVTELVEHDTDIDEWLATGLPADRVIAYLHAGVTLHEYDDFENSGSPTDEALNMLAGFLQAP